MNNVGRVYLVGAGPGDPDLLTCKAARLLGEVDVVVYDRLVSQAILSLVPEGVSRIYVGKAAGRHVLPQEEINRVVLRLARGGHNVVRLKGGDPFVFGRGGEEALFLRKHGVPFEVVPGVTAATACAAYAGIPVTHRGLASGVQLLAGHCRGTMPLDFDWRSLVDPQLTVVFYMGLANLDQIQSKLLAAGRARSTPAAVVQNGTLSVQRRLITTLDRLSQDVADAAIRPPAVVIIGEVVSLAGELDWFVSDIAPQLRAGLVGASGA